MCSRSVKRLRFRRLYSAELGVTLWPGALFRRNDPMQLGFVGTGTMGAPMAACLIDAGHQLTIYDIRAEAMADLRKGGARVAANPAAAARGTEVVFTSLPGPQEVEAALLEPAT